MHYEPRGKVKTLIDAMSADRQRIWSAEEAAKAMGVPAFRSTVLAYTDSACRNGIMFRRMSVGGDLQLRLTPFDVSEPASVWKAPQMVPPRGTPAPTVQPPAGKAEAKLEKIRADIAADMEPRGDRANRVLVDRLQEAMPRWAPPEPAPVVPDASSPDAAGAEESDAVTWNVWEDGDMDLFGLVELENGGFRMPAEAVARLRKFVAWMPA